MKKKVYTRIDAELQTLLDLNGIIYPLLNDFWKNVDGIVKG
jgi:hypothetical protein